MKRAHGTPGIGPTRPVPLALLLSLLAVSTQAQPVVLVSKGQPGPGSANATSQTSVPPRNGASEDGRFFVFVSQATNLVPGQSEANGGEDVFLYDRINDTVKLVSRSNADPTPLDPTQTGNGESKEPVISRDGLWVAFNSTSTNLRTGGQADTPGTFDVFLWSALDGSIQLVSHAFGAAATAANAASDRPTLFGDGSIVAYQSQATNLLGPLPFVDGNGSGRDIFRYIAGTNALVSHNAVAPNLGGNGDSFDPVINVNGTVAIAFTSKATNLLPAQVDAPGTDDVFVGNGGLIELMSHAVGQPTTTGNAPSDRPSISDDGNFVAFRTQANNLVAGDLSPQIRVVLADRSLGPPSATTLVSHAAGFATSANGPSDNPVISGDGLWVAFQSGGTDLIPSQVDSNAAFDVFLFNVALGTNQMVSHRAGTSLVDRRTAASGASTGPEISKDGSRVAFISFSQDVAPGQLDTNGQPDIFVWDSAVDATAVASRRAGTAATTGGPPGSGSDLPVLSGDGRFVAFKSSASDLVTGDANNFNDVFLVEATFVDLQVDKTSMPPARPGAPFGYTVVVRNVSSVVIAGATVTDAMPLTLLGATWSCVATPFLASSCTSNGTGDINDTVTLAPGGNVTYTISGTLALFPTFGSITNQATVTYPPAFTDIDPSNDTDSTADLLAPDAALTLTHDDSPDPVFTNGGVTYLTRITNTGPSATVELNLTVGIPTGATFVSVDNPACTFTLPTVDCTSPALGDLLPGEFVVVRITIQAPNVPGLINSLASASSNTSATVNATADTLVVDPSSSFIELFTATSIASQNTLEWRTPLLGYDHTKIRYRSDGTCPTAPTLLGDGFSNDLVIGALEPGPGAKGFVQHVGLFNDTTYCYAIWVARDPGEATFSVANFAKGRPFDTSGPAKWAFSTGATAVTPPGIGGPGVYVPSNDRALYGIGRGTLPPAGEWVPGFTPVVFSLPVQSRPPVVPLTILGQNPIVFGAPQDGSVAALGANQGDPDPINSPPDALWTSPLGAPAQASPAAWLQAFGGADWVFPSTRAASNNSVFALDATTGFIVGPNGAFGSLIMGPVSGGPAVDYTNQRIYFTSRVGGDGKSVRCLPLVTTPGSEGFGLPCWEATGLGDIDHGPVLRNGSVFVARNTGAVSALDAATGVLGWTFPGIGLPNGFPVMDRANEDLYISAGGRVRALTHLVPTARWTVASIPNPSQPLYSSIGGVGYVWVGSSDGQLYQIDAATGGDISEVLLGDGASVIGAPSLDVLNGVIYVGSDKGVVYGVQVPLPPP